MVRRVLTVAAFLAGLLVMLAAPALAGDAEVGLVNTDNGEWHLREPNGDDRNFFYGNPGDVPLLGDWNCDGVDTPGMFRPSTGFVFLTSVNPPDNGSATGTTVFFFGVPGDLPIAGDWNGDGCDTLGIYRNGQVFLRNSLSTGFADISYFFGVPGDRPFAGDWDGDGIDTPGIYRNSTGQVFYTNENPVGPVATTANDFFYGIPSDEFIPGDWDDDGIDTVGIYRGSVNTFFLRNTNSTGPADETFTFGTTGWTPVAGDLELREATLTASTGLLDIGPVGITNSTGSANLGVSFSGAGDDTDLQITSITFGGIDATSFSAAPLADPNIAFGETKNIEVSLTADTLGVKHGFIRIRHTGVGSPLLVNLEGQGSYRVNAGGDPIGDWGADSPYSPGGNIGALAATSVSGPTAPDEVFESYRFGAQGWDFPVTPGKYRVNLYFAETFSGTQGNGLRQFDVSIEGVQVLDNFDIFAAAGANNGIVRSFDTVSNANLDIDFTQVVNSPAISGIEVIPIPEWRSLGASPNEAVFGSVGLGDSVRRTVTVAHLGEPGTPNINLAKAQIFGSNSNQFGFVSGSSARTLQPGQISNVVIDYVPNQTGIPDARLFISHDGVNSPLEVDLVASADNVVLYRLNTGGDAVVGQSTWSPDEAFLSGGLSGEFETFDFINRSDSSIPASTPDAVLRTERFGSAANPLSWDLPIANGPYEVRLYFVEPVHNAANIRQFDVKVEGGLAINDLDVYARAGGKNIAIMIPVQTNVSGGVLDIDLVPIAGKNLPAIHGIEVIKKEGNAFLNAEPTSLTLGPISVTGQTTGTVDIVNAGGAGIPSVVVEAVGIGGINSGRFTLLDGPEPGDVILPGDGVTAQVRFIAGWAGDKSASYVIVYNGGRTLTIPLIGSVNDPPVLNTPPNQTVNEGVPFSVTATATDPDFDFRIMSATGLPSWASITEVAGGTITIGGTPGFADAGSTVVTVTVTDPDGAFDTGSFTITVVDQNRPPTFNSPLLDQADTEGDTVSIPTQATDLDGDDLTWSSTPLPQGISIDPGSGLISGTLGFLAFDNQPLTGSYTIDVTVTDNGTGNLSATDRFLWTISDANRAPTANSVSPGVQEGGPVTFTITGSDLDGDSLTFSVFGGGPTNGSITLGPVPTGPTSAEITYQHNGSETLSDSFQIRAFDGTVFSAPATVSLVVAPVNERPVATVGITSVVAEGGSVVVGLTGTDPDGDPLTFLAFAPVNGTVGAVTSTGPASANVTFTHDGSETATASFNFQADDGPLTSVTATVNLTVTLTNDRPVATVGITSVVAEGGSVVVGLTATDGDGDPLTFAAFSPTNGSLGAVTSTGPTSANVTFTHDGSETSTAFFNFNATDGIQPSVNATVNLTVTAVNDRPVATVGITSVVAEGGSVVVGLTATDGDGDSLTFSAFAPVNGSVGAVTSTGVASADVTFTHDGSETTTASFNFNATDGIQPSVNATVNLTVNLANDRPVATTGITAVVAEGGSVVVSLTGTDGDLDPLTFIPFAPTNGSLSGLTSTGPTSADVTFTHNGSETTSAAFNFQADDGIETSVTASVAITVIPQNDAPVITEGAGPVPVTMSENGVPTPFSLTLNATDVDSGTLTWSISSPASNGSAGASGTGLSKAITYTPTLNFNGSDSFTVQVSDGNGGTDTIIVNVTIDPINDAPVITEGAGPVPVTMSENGVPTPFSLTLNATDVDSGTLTWSISSPASNGSAGASGTGLSKAITYTPTLNFNGSDSFTVQVSDGNGGTDTIVVDVTVEAVNQAPVITEGAGPVPVTMSEDGVPTPFSLTLNATDADLDALTWSISSPASNGSAGASGTGLSKAITYTPTLNFNGSDSFTVQVSDGNGGTDTIIVNVTIDPINDAPVPTASADPVIGTASGPAVSFTILPNDPDLGDTHSCVVTIQPAAGFGTVSFTGTDCSTGSFSPGATTGPSSFTLTVDDGVGPPVALLVGITVNP